MYKKGSSSATTLLCLTSLYLHDKITPPNPLYLAHRKQSNTGDDKGIVTGLANQGTSSHCVPLSQKWLHHSTILLSPAPLSLFRLLTFHENGAAAKLDNLMRQCLREFPHTHSSLLQQMVVTLAKVSPVRKPCSVCSLH